MLESCVKSHLSHARPVDERAAYRSVIGGRKGNVAGKHEVEQKREWVWGGEAGASAFEIV